MVLDIVLKMRESDWRQVNLPIVELRVRQTLFGLHSHIQNARRGFGSHDARRCGVASIDDIRAIAQMWIEECQYECRRASLELKFVGLNVHSKYEVDTTAIAMMISSMDESFPDDICRPPLLHSSSKIGVPPFPSLVSEVGEVFRTVRKKLGTWTR